MHIERLALRNFRNLAPVDLALSPGTLVLRGRNAQGKTNILEALYLAATGRSFRAAPPRDMLRWGESSGWVKAGFERHEVRHLVEVLIEPGRRTLRVDDRFVRSAGRLLDLVNVVAFFPDDLRIVKGSPEERRRFLDRAVANFEPQFYDAAIAYQRALRARNALLRTPERVEPSLVAAYDTQLVRHGALVHAAREALLATIAPAAVSRFGAITRESSPLAVELAPGVELATGADFAQAFADELARSLARDRAQGQTSVGPHRADLLLSIGGRDARLFASQGQQRALVLALKLAELACLCERLGTAPILLLDDVSSELDAERTKLLFAALPEFSTQVWVTTTGAVPLPLAGETLIFEIENGVISSA